MVGEDGCEKDGRAEMRRRGRVEIIGAEIHIEKLGWGWIEQVCQGLTCKVLRATLKVGYCAI